jgi:hypothetical protein
MSSLKPEWNLLVAPSKALPYLFTQMRGKRVYVVCLSDAQIVVCGQLVVDGGSCCRIQRLSHQSPKQTRPHRPNNLSDFPNV